MEGFNGGLASGVKLLAAHAQAKTLKVDAQAPLRICHLGKYYPPSRGEMEIHLQTLARSQADLGAEVRVICVNHEGRGARVVEEQDGPVRVTRISRMGNVGGLDLCPTLMFLLWRLRGESMDLMHLHTPNPTMLLPLVRGCPAPLVITHHSDIVRQRILRYAHGPFERVVYDRARSLLSDSSRYVEGSHVLQRYSPKVETLPLGIELTPYLEPSPRACAVRDELRSKHGSPLWLSVCRLVYYKGLNVAIDALREVPGKLMVVGSGPLGKKLRQQAEANGVADRVIWLGNSDAEELIGAYRAATALWFPSVARSESFGLVQVEAMASGCPVINSNLVGSGVPWVSLHEETGLTIPVGDAPALAAAARRLVNEPGLRDRLVTAGRQRAIDEFDHRTMGKRSLAIYRRALLKPQP